MTVFALIPLQLMFIVVAGVLVIITQCCGCKKKQAEQPPPVKPAADQQDTTSKGSLTAPAPAADQKGLGTVSPKPAFLGTVPQSPTILGTVPQKPAILGTVPQKPAILGTVSQKPAIMGTVSQRPSAAGESPTSGASATKSALSMVAPNTGKGTLSQRSSPEPSIPAPTIVTSDEPPIGKLVLDALFNKKTSPTSPETNVTSKAPPEAFDLDIISKIGPTSSSAVDKSVASIKSSIGPTTSAGGGYDPTINSARRRHLQ
uniref:Uncharacterized protein n=1 Tax=Globodera pallida TaxID=36090 RepID=A0A183CQM5_GLOPA